ncbi:hypothetical protein GLAREA_03019 [Glarea lozoyensis ATCC 20868]|uniref:F-box domain-containing protein n=1 Tax=Glarea lozoyensis (strain ATCC 20868 / MF5171) TaxID=1116229 RepID=S3CN03_GLAL2|nr:uncharacterized protein GLAREA_03019 [Glarea lozoyensis ATCC 20868]EPE27105.1 hypothetical protein GLAREA_03019 [Glarea lozoyensis ATCC 20868]
MSITLLSTELLQRIYEYATIHDALHLSQTSKRNYRAFLGRRMPIMYQAMHNSYGPLPELVKLVISNEQDRSRRPMGTELRRNNVVNRILEIPETPKLTIELMKKMLEYGKVAETWAEVYPRLRWRFGSDSRRFLRSHERQRLRQAIYIHWTYTSLFHDQTYTQFAPDPPVNSSQDDPRLRLLRAYPGTSLAQLSEFHFHIMQVIEHDLYPSNQVILDHYSHNLPWRSLEKLAWGERGNDYWRLVRAIMKFNPRDMLHLVEHTSTKTERADFLRAQGPHFPDTPETLNEALRVISAERSQEAKATSDPSLRVPYCHSFAVVFDLRQEDIEYWGGHETGIVDVSPAEIKEATARRSLHSQSANNDLSLGSRGLGFLLSNAGIHVTED